MVSVVWFDSLLMIYILW